MKTIIINISRSDVLAEVAKTTAYTGVKSPADEPGSLFDRVATVEEDADILARYWTDACGLLAERLKEFVSEADFGEEGLGLRLDVSAAYDDSLTPSVRSGIFSLTAARMTACWFRLTFPERAAEWEAETERLLAETLRKLYHRRPPRR